MKIKTRKTTEWITVKDADGNEAQFLVEPITPKENSELLRKYSKKYTEGNRVHDDSNFFGFKMEKINRVIKDWKMIEDANGTPMECNKENKEIAYLYNAELIDAALDKADELAKFKLDQSETSLKN
ncbi:MAG: hypothetical protein HQK77_21930 [Desulfobacterales bacterium]|nr:hypothetical protein [Desulfobacterales bacterium]